MEAENLNEAENPALQQGDVIPCSYRLDELYLEAGNRYRTADKKYTIESFLKVKHYDYVEVRPYGTIMRDYIFRGKSFEECIAFLNDKNRA